MTDELIPAHMSLNQYLDRELEVLQQQGAIEEPIHHEKFREIVAGLVERWNCSKRIDSEGKIFPSPAEIRAASGSTHPPD